MKNKLIYRHRKKLALYLTVPFVLVTGYLKAGHYFFKSSGKEESITIISAVSPTIKTSSTKYNNLKMKKQVSPKNIELINKFYTAFANLNAEQMISCYSDSATFYDPAFGTLHGKDAKKMWRMLIDKSQGNLKITYSNVTATETSGSADWVAEYVFSQSGRKVINHINAKFEFWDGKIIKHTDTFDFYKWTKQALGIKGYLFGWTGFMKKQVRKFAIKSLDQYNPKQ